MYGDPEQDSLLAIAIAIAVKRKRERKLLKRKRIWAKDVFRLRDFLKPEENNDFLDIELQSALPTDFRHCLRDNDGELYTELLDMIRPSIEKKNTLMRDAISAHQRLFITLKFLATGISFCDIQNESHISPQSIGRILIETCSAIIMYLKEDYMRTPCTEEQWRQVSFSFNNRWNYPNCLGSVDGIHIPLKKPPHSGSSYFNYKKFFSLVLMGVVNSDYEFLMVDASIKGRTSDGEGFVAANSFVDNLLATANDLPDTSYIADTIMQLPYVFVGDEPFPLRDKFMKPFTHSGLEIDELYYNDRLERAYHVVDNAFGVLCSRFAVLQRTMHLEPEKAQIITLACCYLHNFLLRKARDKYITPEMVDTEDEVNGDVIGGTWRDSCDIIKLERNVSDHKPNIEAEEIRKNYCHYFNNEAHLLEEGSDSEMDF